MDGEQTSFALQFLAALVGGLLSGGILIAWIEMQRLRREKREWELKDSKVALKVLCADAVETLWSANHTKDEKVKLKIYETGMEGKVSEFLLLIQIAITNLTNIGILIKSCSLEIPQPETEKVKKDAVEKYKAAPAKMLRLFRYNLMDKSLLENNDFPLLIPANSTIGITYFGEWSFDFPILVNKAPSTATFKMELDDGTYKQVNLVFERKDSIDMAFASDGCIHWAPYLEKHVWTQNETTTGDESIPF